MRFERLTTSIGQADAGQRAAQILPILAQQPGRLLLSRASAISPAWIAKLAIAAALAPRESMSSSGDK